MTIKRRPSDPESAPVRTPARGIGSDGTLRESAARKKRVLLVDDSPAILSFLKARLVRLDCDFLDAEDATRALRLASLMLVDLVIADVNMPGLDGIEFVKRLRANESERIQKLPVILLTGDRAPELRERGLAAGAQDFLMKPVGGDALASSVERLLRGGGT
jgi:two-component system chemotaxis response regulator CheY